MAEGARALAGWRRRFATAASERCAADCRGVAGAFKLAAQLHGGGSGAVPVGSRGGAVRFQAPEQLRGGGLGAVRGR